MTGDAAPGATAGPATGEARREGLPPSRLLLLSASAVASAATALQTGWMERAKAAIIERVRGDAMPAGLSSPIHSAEIARSTFGLDAAVALLILAAGLVGTAVAARRAARSSYGLASLVPASALGRLALLLAVTWSFVRWHVSPGALFGADLSLHAAHVSLFADELRAGRLPSWSDAWYLGFPLGRHYGVAFYAPAGLLAVPFGVRFAVNATTALWHLAAAPAAYRLARTAGASRGVALVAGIAYAACPSFAFTLGHLGSLTAAPIVALAPLALSEAIRAAREDGLASAVRAGGVLALCALAHPAYAVQVATLTALAFAATAATAAPSLLRALRSGSVVAITAFLGALPVLAAWFVDGLPRAGVAPGLLDLVRPDRPDVESLRQMLRWSVRPDLSGAGYVGIAALLLALVGFVRPSAGERRPWLGALLAATVVVWCGPDGYVRQRALLLVPATLVPLVAAGLARAASGRAMAAVVVGVVLAADLTLGSLVSPHRADLDGLASDLAAETAQQEGGRTILLSIDSTGRVSGGEWQVAPESPLRVVTGGFREAAPPAYGMEKATIDAAVADPTLREPTLRRHLAALGVTSVRLVRDARLDPDALRLPHEPAVRFAPIAARTTAPANPTPDQLLAWTAAMQAPAGSSPTAIRRVILPGDGPPLPEHEDEAPLLGVTVHSSERVGSGRTLDVDAPSAGWLRLDAAWLPGLAATIDGSAVVPQADVFGLVALRVESPGRHRVVVELPTRPALALGPLVAAIAVAVTSLRRRPNALPADPTAGAPASAASEARST